MDLKRRKGIWEAILSEGWRWKRGGAGGGVHVLASGRGMCSIFGSRNVPHAIPNAHVVELPVKQNKHSDPDTSKASQDVEELKGSTLFN